MKKRIILFFAMLATMVLLAVGLTIGASASTYDVSTADDFTSKISSAASGDTINVTADISVSTQCTIDKTLTITSSNGSTVTVGVSRLFLVGTSGTAGTLTIDGNVKFETTGTFENVVTMVNGTAYIKGNARISAYCTPILLMTNVMKENSTVYIQENAVIEVTAAIEKNMFYMTTIDGNANAAKGTVYVQGGTLSNPNGKCFEMAAGYIYVSGGTIEAQYPIFLFYGNAAAQKTVEISGGNINGSVTGIYFNSNCQRATVTVSGGIVTGTSRGMNVQASNNTGNSITITGGTVSATGSGNHAIALNGSTLTVSGGTITAPAGGINITGSVAKTLTVETGAYIYGGTYGITTDGSNHTLNITGGTVIGGTADIKDGVTVNSRTGGCVSSGGTYYTSLKTAISSVASGSTITVLENTKVPAAITIDKTITITTADSTEKTVTSSVAKAFKVGTSGTAGTLTLDGYVKLSATGTYDNTITMINGTVTIQGHAGVTDYATPILMSADHGMVANCTVNIKDSATVGVTTTGDANIFYMVASTTAVGTVNVSGGTLTNTYGKCFQIVGGTVNFSGGTINAQYPFHLSHDAAKSVKNLTISGGTVTGSQAGIYVHTNAKHLTLTITGGTVSSTNSNGRAIWYKSTQASADNSIEISGGTITAPWAAIRFESCSAVPLTINGTAVVRSTNGDGGNTIYGSNMTGNLTLTVSGSPSITANGASAIVVTDGAGKLVATISGGTISANSDTIKLYSGSLTMTAGTISATTTNAIHCHKDGGSISISGGTVSADSQAICFPDNNGAKTLNISGTARITATWSTVFLNRTGAVTMTVTGGTIEATSGGNTIYGAELRGDLTLNISGSSSITATGNSAIVVAMPGDTSTYPGKLVATISGGTISAASQAVDVKHGSVTITGGTISASSVAIYANKPGASITISGGTVTAEANTIALQGEGTKTLNISGSAIVRATSGNGAITSDANATPTIAITGGTISASGDFCIDTRTGTVAISGGTLTAGGYCTYLRGTVGYTITGGKLTAGANAVFAVSSTSGVTLNISDGIFILNGNSYGAKIIAETGTTTDCTITVNGGLFVSNNSGNYKIIDDFSGSDNTVTLNALKAMYRNNIDTITGGIAAPKTAQAVYDANGNGTVDEGETYYFFAKFPKTDNTYSGTMATGASVRLASASGIRFTTDYSAAVVSALEAKGSVTYGTIILPTTYLVRVNAFTKAALDAAEISYCNIVAADGLIDNGDGSYTVRAALTNLDDSNYGLSFSAVSYALVNGTYYYTAYSTTDNARTMQEIAQAALDDLSETQTGEYQYAVSVYGVDKYSPYTSAQRAALQNYIEVTVDTPVLAGKSLTLVRSGEDTYQYYNTSASLTDYNNYKSTLVGAGYTLFAEKTMDSNKFATYTGNGKVLTLSFTPATTTLRLLMESSDNTALPTTSAQNAGYGTGTATKVTQIGLWDNDATESHKSYYYNTTWGENRDYATTNNAGMCYVIQLSDGSFIVIDGGYNTATHAENLYNVMKKQAGSETFTIAAWIFTHVHDDHAGAFRAFTENKKYNDKVTIERFIYNFPSGAAHLANGQTSVNSFRINVLEDMSKYAGAKTTIAHAGQEFYIRNAQINILFAADLMEPHSLEYYNSVSLVFQIVLEGKKLIFFGDCGGNSGFGGSEMAYINNIYSATTLSSDFLQASHHGLDPETDSDGFSLTNFYKNKVSPTYVFFPVASEYVKVDGSYIILEQRNESYLWGRTKYIARDDVVVVTLSGGNATANTYDDVTTYVG